MIVTPIKTHKIKIGEDILGIIDKYLLKDKGLRIKDKNIFNHSSFILNHSILVITSKIISLCQKRVVKIGSTDKDKLIKRESNLYLPRGFSRYQVSFTIKDNMLVPTAGIDESNGDGYYILWPKDVQKVANEIREYIIRHSGKRGTSASRIPSGNERDSGQARMTINRNFGVIITDSRTAPLRWGVTASSIAYSGFKPLKDYIGVPDLYGRPFAFEKLNIADSLAAAAGFVMGEGAEQIPMALITDLPNVEFQDRNPTEDELSALRISIEDDLYAPLLTSVKWQKGEK